MSSNATIAHSLTRFANYFGAANIIITLLSQGSLALNVGIYGSGIQTAISRVESLGYGTVSWTDPAEVNAANLTTVDVLFVHSVFAYQLDSQATLINNWVAEGHGLIVEQPNRTGDVGILPPLYEISIFSSFYDGTAGPSPPIRGVVPTAAGIAHPLTAGLLQADFPENFDRVRISDVSPQYEILAVQRSNPNYAALAVADYQAGRIVFETGNTQPESYWPGSDLYLQRIIDWAAGVPEPSTALLLLLGCVAAGTRRVQEN